MQQRSTEYLHTALSNGVLTVTIARPEAKNALTLAMRQEIESICRGVDDQPDIAALVLVGVDDVFSAGADIKEIANHPGGMPSTNPGEALRKVRKPTIAAVNGICITGGLELALSCDWIVASDRARFADTHARLGVLPRWGMSALLAAAVGTARAKEITLTGRMVDAAEAHTIGLAARVISHDGFDAQIADMAQHVAAAPAGAVLATIDLYNEGSGTSVAEALELERQRIDSFQSEPGALGNV